MFCVVKKCSKSADELMSMTLNGKYRQCEYPGLESKENGISNFAEEDSSSEDCAQFPEVYELFYYDLQIIIASWLFSLCGLRTMFACPPTQQIQPCCVSMAVCNYVTNPNRIFRPR